MSIRVAMLPLLFVGLWACGDDDDGPTAPVVDPRAAAADSMLAAAGLMVAAADSMMAANADSVVARADAMAAAADSMRAAAASLAEEAESLMAANAELILAMADSLLAAAGSLEAAADSILSAGGGVLRPSGELLPWDLSAVVSIDDVRSMPHGMPLYMRTEFANGELADLEMRFVQVVDDFLPPMPVIMVEASDPVLIQLGGIARGMSGSPVFSEEGTWGAIAYGFSSQDSPPYYFFATPIEWVIGERSTVPLAKPVAAWGDARIVPLETPLVSTGLHGGQSRVEGGVLSTAAAAGLTQDRQESFEAGRPLAVGLLLGEITAGSIGTISYVDGDRVYGFGHPMNQSGSVRLPIIEARVLGEISNLSAPFKFATLNPTVRGTLTEDSLPAVRGVLDGGPELVPARAVYTLASGAEVELEHRMPAGVDQSGLLPYASFYPLFNRLDNKGNHSLRVSLDVSFVGTDEVLTRSRIHTEPAGRLFNLVDSAWFDLSDVLYQLMGRNDYILRVREAEVRVEVIPEPRFATLVEVDADTVASPGDVITVTTSLRVGRRLDRQVEVDLGLPEEFPPGIYQLEAGSAATLGPDQGGGGGFDPFFGFGSDFGFPGDGAAETLEEVFARVNGPDESTQMKARLTYLMPLPVEGPPEGEGPPDSGAPDGTGGFLDGFFPQDPGPPPTVSTQEEVGLYLDGQRTLQITVVAAE